ncbi:MAG TPA: NADH-quinone oxidoreductase subunit L [bacterium]|jgi:NADH-quinone oxidoreductase subunit L|nr:NADH-quinone oxidoreductase subunit L [bacterium]
MGIDTFQYKNLIQFDWIWLILAAPLLGALVNGLLVLISARRKSAFAPALHATLACGAVILSFLASWFTFLHFKALPDGSILTQELFDWIEAGTFHVKMGFELDALSMTMVVFITFVSSLIHLYSIGYMKDDPGFGRFFTYLNLFLFSMLVLVMGQNLLVLFLGWEGVGFCSYLLIGFWFEDEAKANAGKKAIIVNRIGDAGFLAGLLVVFALAGTFNFDELQLGKHAFSELSATIICLCFFFGAAGKSAQIPLYVWLPDAMAGPTPVSALIHAATMVTAGVYLIARLNFLFVLAPWASTLVAVIGVLTALLAATIALGQTDIKKVLAYSTISQLGFMFLGVGVSAYGAGIFHLITHGFFKACLFLAAGSVIHAMKGEQDIRKMGGLLKHLPVTSVSFLLGWMAISGILPFCGGFNSKDAILWKTLATPNPVIPFLPEILYFTALFTAFLTAFYMTRLVVLVFFGDYRGDQEIFEHVHESPKIMTVPLLVLAIGSIVCGWIGMPESIGGGNSLGKFLEPIFHLSTVEATNVSAKMEPLLMLMSFLVAGLGVGMAWYVYGWKHTISPLLLKMIPGGKKAIEKKYYVDEIYDVLVVRMVRGFAEWVSNRLVEQILINRVVEGIAQGLAFLARLIQKTQVGLVRVYLAYVVAGAALLIYLILH